MRIKTVIQRRRAEVCSRIVNYVWRGCVAEMLKSPSELASTAKANNQHASCREAWVAQGEMQVLPDVNPFFVAFEEMLWFWGTPEA